MDASESAFRRGYHQGVCAALDAAEVGTPEQLRKWYEEITAWRERRHESYVPPGFKLDTANPPTKISSV